MALVAALLLSFGTFVAYASVSPNALVNGDTALMALQISALDFSSTTIHLGYYIIVAILNALFSLSSAHHLNLVNCLFGSLSVGLVSFMVFSISRSHLAAIGAGLLLATNYLFVLNSVYAEVYLPQTFFILLSIATWHKKKPMLAGFSFAVAFLIMPSTIFALPIFPILRWDRKALLRFAVPAVAVPALLLLPHYEDYLFGGRGLMGAATRSVVASEAALKEGHELFFGMYASIPFIAAGMVLAISGRRFRALGVGIGILWLLTFAFAESTTVVPVQLPTWALLYIIGALGILALNPAQAPKGRRWIWVPIMAMILLGSLMFLATLGSQEQISPKILVGLATSTAAYTAVMFAGAYSADPRLTRVAAFLAVALAVGLNGYLSFRMLSYVIGAPIDYRDTAIEIERIGASDSVFIGGYDQGVLYEYYAFNNSFTGRWINTEWLWGIGEWETWRSAEAINQWESTLYLGREVWLAEEYPELILDLQQAGYHVEPFRQGFRATRN